MQQWDQSRIESRLAGYNDCIEVNMSSFVIKVKVKGETEWGDNGMYFPSREDAEAWAYDMETSRTLGEQTRVERDTKPPNYHYVNGSLKQIVVGKN
jgi:hypothetical protein